MELKNGLTLYSISYSKGLVSLHQIDGIKKILEITNGYFKILENQQIGIFAKESSLPELQHLAQEQDFQIQPFHQGGLKVCIGGLCPYSKQKALEDTLEWEPLDLTASINGCEKQCSRSYTDKVWCIGTETGYDVYNQGTLIESGVSPAELKSKLQSIPLNQDSPEGTMTESNKDIQESPAESELSLSSLENLSEVKETESVTDPLNSIETDPLAESLASPELPKESLDSIETSEGSLDSIETSEGSLDSSLSTESLITPEKEENLIPEIKEEPSLVAEVKSTPSQQNTSEMVETQGTEADLPRVLDSFNQEYPNGHQEKLASITPINEDLYEIPLDDLSPSPIESPKTEEFVTLMWEEDSLFLIKGNMKLAIVLHSAEKITIDGPDGAFTVENEDDSLRVQMGGFTVRREKVA